MLRVDLTAEIVVDSVLIPAEHVIGAPGKGLGVALFCMVRGRIGIGGAGVGVAQAALDHTIPALSAVRIRSESVSRPPSARRRLPVPVPRAVLPPAGGVRT